MSRAYNNRKATLKKVKGISTFDSLQGKRSKLAPKQKELRDGLILKIVGR